MLVKHSFTQNFFNRKSMTSFMLKVSSFQFPTCFVSWPKNIYFLNPTNVKYTGIRCRECKVIANIPHRNWLTCRYTQSWISHNKSRNLLRQAIVFEPQKERQPENNQILPSNSPKMENEWIPSKWQYFPNILYFYSYHTSKCRIYNTSYNRTSK